MRFFFLLPLLFLPACATPPVAPKWTPPVSSFPASFCWRQGKTTVAGDADIAWDRSGNLSLHLTKGLPAPILTLNALNDGRLSISGPAAGRPFCGPSSAVPPRLAIFAAFNSAWRTAATLGDGRREIHSPAYRAVILKKTGAVREVSTSSTDSGALLIIVPRNAVPGRRGSD